MSAAERLIRYCKIDTQSDPANEQETPSSKKQFDLANLLVEELKELGLQSMPKISIIVNDAGLNKKIAETLQENFRVNLGIEVDVELIAFKERLQRMHNANYDIALAGWSADYLDPMTYLDLFVSNSGNNHGKYSNPQYDALIKEAKTTNDPNKRFEAFKKAEEIIAKDVPIAPLFQIA